MPLLVLLGGWVYGADVEAAGDPDYGVRHAATRRLEAVGWPAYPALLAGASSDVPERAERCERLIERLPGPLTVIQRQCDVAVGELIRADGSVPELTPGTWLLLELAVCRAAGASAPVKLEHPDGRYGCSLDGGFRDWVRRPAFYSGSHAGDVRLLCEAVRMKRTTQMEK